MAYIDDTMDLSLTKSSILLLAILLLPGAVSGREITVLYTNDIESVYEPVEAWWRDDMTRMGGMAKLSTLINNLRETDPATIVVDAGDMFTGSLSKATRGRLVFDLYSAMGYDAVNLGNHEFEYGWKILREVMPRARFPVLNANIFYEGTDISFGQQYTILQKGDVRIGVIGVMGVDAFINTMMKANRQGLTVRAPEDVLQPIVDLLRPEVDLLLVLTHQNRTAPMQTNKEADPEVQRGYDEDFALAGVIKGVDMIIGGHSDHGLLQPVRHPVTGTLIGMTFGQGMHLGYARFDVGKETRLIDARLIPVNADELDDNPELVRLIDRARAQHPALTEVVGLMENQAARRYYRESPLGNILADMLRHYAGADVSLIPAGAIRADLEEGEVTVEEVLNVFPFTDTVAVITVSGRVLEKVLEKGLSLDYGLAQFSGVELKYDGRQPVGRRLVSATVDGAPIDPVKDYQLVTMSFTATGGENYTMFEGLPVEVSEVLVSDALIQEFRRRGDVAVPKLGRQVDLAVTGN